MPDNLTIPARNAKRGECRIFVTISLAGQTALARVANLSQTGLALELRDAFTVTVGNRVSLVSPELGHLEGTVRWLRNGQIGVEYKLTSNALAQVSAYFRFFHEELKPVVKR